MLVLAVMKSSVARCRMWSRLTERWWSKFEVLDRLAGGEPGGAGPVGGAVRAAGGGLGFQAGGEVFLVGPAVGAGALGEPLGGVPQRGEL